MLVQGLFRETMHYRHMWLLLALAFAIDYARPVDAVAPLALWMLQPLAWMAQGASIMGMLGLSALSVATPAAFARPLSK